MKQTGRVLVTGGCGFIGRFTVMALLALGFDVVVLDDLRNGSAANLPKQVLLHSFDLGDQSELGGLMKREGIASVVHLAGLHSAPASVREPLAYYQSNSDDTRKLLNACREAEVEEIVFASTSLVYAAEKNSPLRETDACSPVSPYARSKMMCEWLIADSARSHGHRFCNLRYFNVAGAAPDGSWGPTNASMIHAVQALSMVATGRLAEFKLFAHGFPTPDGTAVRDYVHVLDVARANALAVRHLRQGGASLTLNIGTGVGTSTLELIANAEFAFSRHLPVKLAAPEPSGPAFLAADTSLAELMLGWRPEYSLRDILSHAWLWESNRGIPSPRKIMEV